MYWQITPHCNDICAVLHSNLVGLSPWKTIKLKRVFTYPIMNSKTWSRHFHLLQPPLVEDFILSEALATRHTQKPALYFTQEKRIFTH
jgi:hypothetical protein